MLTAILAVPVSASIPRTNESASSANFVIEDYSLAEFTEHLQSAPMILQISLHNNEPTYITTDGTHTTVSKEPVPTERKFGPSMKMAKSINWESTSKTMKSF